MNNAANDLEQTAAYSTGMFVALDRVTMTATLMRAFPRPDGKVSRLRGNVQELPNTNVVVNWSENGYVTEFTAEGIHVLDASFGANRFGTYRAYKFNTTLMPSDQPVMKSFVFGENPVTSTSVFYVSWNGATEVASWKFFASQKLSGEFSLIGEAPRAGFETSYHRFGCYQKGFVEAVAADGTVLGQSAIENLILPLRWQKGDQPKASDGLQEYPDDSLELIPPSSSKDISDTSDPLISLDASSGSGDRVYAGQGTTQFLVSLLDSAYLAPMCALILVVVLLFTCARFRHLRVRKIGL